MLNVQAFFSETLFKEVCKSELKMVILKYSKKRIFKAVRFTEICVIN